MSGGDGKERIILDADGVFMDELPYWRTGLVVAAEAAGLVVGSSARWEALSRGCFEDVRLQQVTKQRGCNSNWDMTAVMVRSLEDSALQRRCSAALGRGDMRGFATLLRSAMEAQWQGADDGQSPLSGFGIERDSPAFREPVARFQEVFAQARTVEWRFPQHALARPADRTRAALQALAARGSALAVCTSRTREETSPPMRDLGVARWFDSEAIVTHDDVRRAQRETGNKPLGKPHWFSLAVASVGYESAVRALRDPGASMEARTFERIVYVGDAPADFLAASSCRRRGLPVAYVHIDSGVSGAEVLAEIERDAETVAVVEDLARAAEVLAEVRS